MVHPGWIAIVGVVSSSLGLAVAWADSDPNTKIASRFEVRFASAEYATSTSVVYYSRGQREQATERLRLNCEIDILDPNLVLGISQGGTIAQFEIDKGKGIEVAGQPAPRPTSRYRALSYRRRWVVPPRPPRWKRAVRSALRLPPPKGTRGYLIHQVQPIRVALELDPALPEPNCEKINRVKGHFYALMAESLEHIEIPYELNEQWVRLPPAIEIKVVEAESTQSEFDYSTTWKRPRAVKAFSPVSDLPSRFVAGHELLGRDGIGQDGKRTRLRIPSPFLPMPVSGGMSGGTGDLGLIEKIRFVIAVNASHHKIPFELEDISLPER